MKNSFPTIIKLFEEQVKDTPHTPAISFKNRTLTYSELNEAANELALTLQNTISHEKTHEVVIAVLLERNVELVIAMLGILKAGAAYCLIDIEYPNERILSCLKILGNPFLITNSHYLKSSAAISQYFSSKIINLNKRYTKNYKHFLKKITNLHSLAYVIFTSGTTGTPKGILIEHNSLSNVINYFKNKLKVTSKDRFLSVTSPGFDIFALEIFLPLISGAECILYDRGKIFNAENLKRCMLEKRPTIMQATPSMWKLLSDINLPSLQDMTVLCGGERLDNTLAQSLINSYKHVYNVYGPSETTIWSLCAEVKKEDKKVLLGEVIDNTDYFVFNDVLKKVNYGEIGELYIGGIGLARGYLNNDLLTQQMFIINPENQKRIYKTGDIVRYISKDVIEYIGRRDNQIKINGFRIELEEIEKIAIDSSKFILDACAVNIQLPSQQIILFCRVESKLLGDKMLEEKLRKQTYKTLPKYMYPADTIFVDKFPLTTNGKIDRKALTKSTSFSQSNEIIENHYIRNIVSKSWAKILNHKDIDIDENFILLGGNSVHIPQIITELNKTLNARLTMRVFMENQTIRKLTEKIEKNLQITI
jgi:amino acid adenylation domain-containing protein